MHQLKYLLPALMLLLIAAASCKKENRDSNKNYTYYQVGFKDEFSEWRDTSFIVRTNNQQLMRQLDTQLTLPVTERKLVVGKLVAGSGGYNKNASHEFKWHFKEDDWQLADVTVEIYDGRPFSDVDTDIRYWLDTVQRYGSWSSYIRKKLPAKPQ